MTQMHRRIKSRTLTLIYYMRLETDIQISLVIPSRGRPDQLNRCLHSFFQLAARPHQMEAIVLADFDDMTMRHFDPPFNVKTVYQRQSRKHIKDYNNYGAQVSTGRYVMILNDDVEMTTKRWDAKIIDRAEQFLHDKPDRLLYIHIDDSTHTPFKREYELGCCFPILTKETVDAMNGIMPGEIDMWGADIALWRIFQQLPEDRILDMIADVKVLHHCRHNHTCDPDETALGVESVSRKAMLTNREMDHYVNALCSKLQPFPD